MSDGEFRVIWRWREDHPNGDLYEERRRLFQTLAGATRLYERLTSNGGRYEKWEDGTGIQTGELVTTRLRLDYARVEAREVGPFLPIHGLNEPAARLGASE
jgi:hypothetical protein